MGHVVNLKMNSATKREVTSYLKGVAIVVVLVNHYICAFISSYWSGYANGFISIFFILSGYGIYYSFENTKTNNRPFCVLDFYVKRMLRMYPLFWVYYLYHIDLDFHKFSIIDFFAVRFTSPEIPWFLPAIIQCYILAPLLFCLLKKYNMQTYFIVTSVILVFVNILFPKLHVLEGKVWFYKNLYLSHIFLFSVGLAMPSLIKKYYHCNQKINRFVLFVIFLLMIFSIQETTSRAHDFIYSQYIFGCLFIILTSSFCFLLLVSNIKPPLLSLFKSIGIYSYSLYLFHGIYYWVFVKLCIIKLNDAALFGSLFVAAIFPIFFYCCALAEELFSKKINLPVSIKTLHENLFDKKWLK